MARRALILGSNGPQGPGRLKYAEADAKRIADSLRLRPYSFEIVEPAGQSKGAVESALSAAAEMCQPTDTLLLYFSGHGLLYKNALRLVLADGHVDAQRFVDALRDTDAQQKLLVLDCCHAGAAGTKNGTLSALDAIPGIVEATLFASDKLEWARELDELGGSFLSSNFSEYLKLTPPHASLTGLMEFLWQRAREHNDKPGIINEVPIPFLSNRERGGHFYFGGPDDEVERSHERGSFLVIIDGTPVGVEAEVFQELARHGYLGLPTNPSDLRQHQLARAVDGAIVLARTTHRPEVVGFRAGRLEARLNDRCFIFTSDPSASVDASPLPTYVTVDSDGVRSAVRAAVERVAARASDGDAAHFLRIEMSEQSYCGDPNPPNDWIQRAAYLGAEGPAALRQLNNAPGYEIHAEQAGVDEQLLSMLNVRAQTYLSLGPGDGGRDARVVSTLKEANPSLSYVAVDMSVFGLRPALATMKSRVTTRLGIVADFEVEQQFILQQLRKRGVGSAIIGLLGGTFGNLDTGEQAFLRGLREPMTASDVLVIEAATKTDKWSEDAEPRMKHGGYNAGYRQLIGNGLEKRNLVEAKEVVRNFDKRVKIVAYDNATDPTLPPGATAIVVKYFNGSLEHDAFKTTRYEPRALLAWLQEQGFTVDKERTFAFRRGPAIGLTVLRVRKPSSFRTPLDRGVRFSSLPPSRS